MIQQAQHRHGFAAGMVTILLIMSIMVTSTPSRAQDDFVTNTPVPLTGTAPSLPFATNTPTVADERNPPSDLLYNYGLRLWLEADFVTFTTQQVTQLDLTRTESQQAISILLYEMARRFPDAPQNMDQRMTLIQALLQAPVGTIDLGTLVLPFVQDTLQQAGDETRLERAGFTLILNPANLAGRSDGDRVVQVQYRLDDVIKYEAYFLTLRDNNGMYRILNPNYDAPIVPFDGVQTIAIDRIQDVDGDTVDELVLRVDDGQASDRFYIIEARNERAFNLVDPNLEMRVGDILSWDVGGDLNALEVVTESRYPDWVCQSQIAVTWRFERNLYRRFIDLNARLQQIDSLGCTLANADLFSMIPSEAISEVENALLIYGFDDPSTNRALMTLAMLYVLNGRLDDARNTAQSIVTVNVEDSWESQQAQALIQAIGVTGNTGLDICTALAQASVEPACDVNAVLGRILESLQISTDDDLATELAQMGLPVQASFIISEIGRADRTVVQFNLPDSGLWGFYRSGDGTYSVEPVAASEQQNNTSEQNEVVAPQAAFDSLLIDDDPSITLTILENAIRNNPDLPIAPATLYLQALANEFTGGRDLARSSYYMLWQQYPDRIWGQLASEHLEQR